MKFITRAKLKILSLFHSFQNLYQVNLYNSYLKSTEELVSEDIEHQIFKRNLSFTLKPNIYFTAHSGKQELVIIWLYNVTWIPL